MKKGWVNVLWDIGVLFSFIMNKKVKLEKLKGIKIELFVIKVGGMKERFYLYKYKFLLIDKEGYIVYFEVYGIDKIIVDIFIID